MGLFFKKRNKKNDTQADDARVYLSVEQTNVPDMNLLVKNEQQQQEIENPFVEAAPTVAQKSVAKRYGDKYIGIAGKQIASSIVVDVRSYKKPEPVKNVSSLFDDEVEEPVDKKTSFFDEIMKSLDDEDDDLDIIEEEKGEIEKGEPKVVVENKPKKSKGSSKRKIDIDIISGDFGGADII